MAKEKVIAPKVRKQKTPKQVIFRILFWILLLVFLLFIIAPIYWCLTTSFKPTSEITSRPVSYWPREFIFDNYVNVWLKAKFNIFFKNSAIVSIFGVLGILIVSFMCGYCLDRYQFSFKPAFMLILLCTQFIPGAMLVIPMYIMMSAVHLNDTLLALVLINITFRFPYDSILMKGFINGVDYTIEEAAQIDGCGRFQTMWRILIPLIKPGIATVAAYAFISCWNEFLYSFMIIDSEKNKTLPVGLKGLSGGEEFIDYGQIAAGAIIAVIPTMILFSYVQKHLVSGITAGGVKG